VTHVLLPAGCLLRRADGVAVIWSALAGKAAGLGYRRVARLAGRAESTVRGWLARFASRAGVVRGVFTAWLCALDADPPPLPPAGRRWPGLLVSLSPGELASSVSGGLLLAPSWAPEWINTSPG
jgi:hypothetical protein